MMEILEMLSSHWLEVAVAAYLIGMMLYGHYRGFIRIAVSVMSLFITLFAVRVAIPQTAAWLEHNTALYETMKESALKASGLDEKMDEMAQPVSPEKRGNAQLSKVWKYRTRSKSF